MTATIELALDKGWGPRILIAVADTAEADQAATAYLRRMTAYELGQENYHVAACIDGQVRDNLAELLYPSCEHGMSAQLCAGPMHFLSYDQERERGW